jgi:hypothetical protein
MIKRKPDFIVGDGYLARWWILPRNRYLNIYLHRFTGDDDDRALHDHPWASMSILLKGVLREHNFKGHRCIPRLVPIIRSAKFAHRLELIKGPAWTIFITGPVTRHWGFHCPNGWVHWKKFVSNTDRGQIGVGCGEQDANDNNKD